MSFIRFLFLFIFVLSNALTLVIAEESNSVNDSVSDGYEGTDAFSTWSAEKKNDYINKYLNKNNIIFYILNAPTLVEPQHSQKKIQQYEAKMQRLLDECVELVGPEADDTRLYIHTTAENNPITTYIRTLAVEFVLAIQPHYLSGRTFKCVRYLYQSDNNKGGIRFKKDGEKFYDLNDFGFNQHLSLKEKKAETLYTQVYLCAKEAGLLRRLHFAVYPKTLLRNYIEQGNFLDYINSSRGESGDADKGEAELMTAFFGSREKWLIDFHQFLDTVITKNSCLSIDNGEIK